MRRLALLALVLLAAPLASGQEDERLVPYEVVDAATGAPVSDVLVSVGTFLRHADDDDPPRVELRTPRGTLPLEPGRQNVVTFSAPGRGTVIASLSRRDPLPASLRVELRPELPLRGRLLDLEGRPVRVPVEVHGVPPDLVQPGVDEDELLLARVVPDAEGRFEVHGLAPGTACNGSSGPEGARVFLTIDEDPGYASVVRHLNVAPGAPPLELRLRRLVVTRGRVVTCAGAPVAGARVRAGAREDAVTTDAAGAFLLQECPERGQLQVEAPELAVQRFERAPGANDLVLRLAAPGPPLEGRVVDPLGRPAKGVAVSVRDGPFVFADDEAVDDEWRYEDGALATAVTDTEGRFELAGLPQGVALHLHAWECEPSSVETRAGARDVRLVRPLTGWIRADPTPWAELSVVEPGGRRLEAWCEVSPGHPTIQVRAGRVLLEAVATGHRLLRREVDVPAGELVDLGRLELVPVVGGRVELRVRWPAAVIYQASAAWLDPEARVEQSESLVLPRFARLPCTIGPIPTEVDSLRVRLNGPGGLTRDVTVPVRVAVGQTTAVEVDLR